MSLYINMETRPWMARLFVAAVVLSGLTNGLVLLRLVSLAFSSQ